jgi:PKD repeat protein
MGSLRGNLSAAALRGTRLCKGLAYVLLLFVLAACSHVNTPPVVAQFSATPISGLAPLVVSFDAFASWSPNGHILSYEWDFGDGYDLPPTPSIEGIMVSHAYQEPGTYDATLRVIDNNNVAATCTRTISVSGPRGTVGSVINNGYVTVELISVRTTSLVGGLAPPPETIYVVVDVRVGAVAGRINCGIFQLMDASGHAQYESAFNSFLDNSFVCGIISTGEQVSGELLFEVPPSSSYTLIYKGDWCEEPITFGFQL